MPFWQRYSEVMYDCFQYVRKMYNFKKRFGSAKILFSKHLVGPVAVVSASYGYSQWREARHALKLNNNEKEMIELFNKLDVDNSGFIDKEELEKALTEAGMALNSFQLTFMMNSADENEDGQISKDDWIAICNKAMADSTDGDGET